jgi:integrase
MTKANYKNEMTKREFFAFLKNSQGFSDSSILSFEKALLFFEDFTKAEDFYAFDDKQAIAFRDWLKVKNRKGTENPISLSYCYDILRFLRKFFEWLVQQPKSKINPTHIGFLNLSRKESQIATRARIVDVPTFEEVIQVLESIGDKTEVERRDRALIAFTLLTGARISAIVSLRMKNFDRRRLVVEQDPASGVKTKFSKQIITVLFPWPNERLLAYFLDWFDYLDQTRGFSSNQPIFPATKLEQGEGTVSYYSTGIVEPAFWSNADPARKIFEKRFKGADIPYYHPHTLRHLIVKEFIKTRLTEEEKKAISQNLGHEDVGTTFGSYGYGKLPTDRQVEVVKGIKFSHPETEQVFDGMSEKSMKKLAKMLKKELENDEK